MPSCCQNLEFLKSSCAIGHASSQPNPWPRVPQEGPKPDARRQQHAFRLQCATLNCLQFAIATKTWASARKIFNPWSVSGTIARAADPMLLGTAGSKGVSLKRLQSPMVVCAQFVRQNQECRSAQRIKTTIKSTQRSGQGRPLRGPV